jgi:hypothetical protein
MAAARQAIALATEPAIDPGLLQLGFRLLAALPRINSTQECIMRTETIAAF